MSKLYKVKSSAKRAGKKALKAAPKGSTLKFVEDDGQFGFILNKPKEAKKDDGLLRKSLIENPCTLVWDIAEKMDGEKRKDIIAACVEAGVAYYTARTQYQKYIEAKRGDIK